MFSLHRPVWIVSLPSIALTALLTWMPSANLLKAYSIPLYVTDKDAEEHRFQHRPLRDTTQLPPGHRAIDNNPLTTSIQPILHPSNSPAFKPHLSNLKIRIQCSTMSSLIQYIVTLPEMLCNFYEIIHSESQHDHTTLSNEVSSRILISNSQSSKHSPKVKYVSKENRLYR